MALTQANFTRRPILALLSLTDLMTALLILFFQIFGEIPNDENLSENSVAILRDLVGRL